MLDSGIWPTIASLVTRMEVREPGIWRRATLTKLLVVSLLKIQRRAVLISVLGAAGYVKVQDYVPYTELASLRHADPALMGILQASLSPYNNDLHLSNIVHIPAMALHGGSDSNVPPRHSRAIASVIAGWQGQTNAIEVVEVKGKDHWWDGMLDHPEVLRFIERALELEPRSWDDERRHGFTLTSLIPEESSGRAGIRIVELDVPGRYVRRLGDGLATDDRMARLDVNAPHWRDGQRSSDLDLRGMNIKRIEVRPASGSDRVEVMERGGQGFVVGLVPVFQCLFTDL